MLDGKKKKKKKNVLKSPVFPLREEEVGNICKGVDLNVNVIKQGDYYGYGGSKLQKLKK